MSDVQSSAICNARLALRLGLGFIWMYEGLVPKLLVPLTGLEKDVVAASGLIPNGMRDPFLHTLGVLEILLGACVVSGLWQRPICVVQAAIVAAFTVVIPITSAAVLAHPFGLLSKNIPVLGAIVSLWLLSASGLANRDGTSAPEEMETAAAAGLVGVGTKWTAAERCDARGNCERERGALRWRSPDGREHRGAAVDVHLRIELR